MARAVAAPQGREGGWDGRLGGGVGWGGWGGVEWGWGEDIWWLGFFWFFLSSPFLDVPCFELSLSEGHPSWSGFKGKPKGTANLRARLSVSRAVQGAKQRE